MTQRNSSTARVDIVGSQTKDLGVGLDDGSEGLVEFPDCDIFFLEARLGEEFLDDGGGGDGEVNWI